MIATFQFTVSRWSFQLINIQFTILYFFQDCEDESIQNLPYLFITLQPEEESKPSKRHTTHFHYDSTCIMFPMLSLFFWWIHTFELFTVCINVSVWLCSDQRLITDWHVQDYQMMMLLLDQTSWRKRTGVACLHFKWKHQNLIHVNPESLHYL